MVWEHKALCRSHDPENWFPDRRDPGWKKVALRAMSMCGSCPVRAQCAKSTLEINEVHVVKDGIWAGVPMITVMMRRDEQLARLRELAMAAK